MKQVRPYASVGISLAITLFAVLLFIVNRGIWLIGLSTVVADAPGAPKGLLELLAAIATMPWWALMLFAIVAIGVHVHFASRSQAVNLRSSKLNDATNDALADILTMKADMHDALAEMGSRLEEMDKTARKRDYLIYRYGRLQKIREDMLTLWNKVDLRENSPTTEDDWENWDADFEIWSKAFTIFIKDAQELFPAVRERYQISHNTYGIVEFRIKETYPRADKVRLYKLAKELHSREWVSAGEGEINQFLTEGLLGKPK